MVLLFYFIQWRKSYWRIHLLRFRHKVDVHAENCPSDRNAKNESINQSINQSINLLTIFISSILHNQALKKEQKLTDRFSLIFYKLPIIKFMTGRNIVYEKWYLENAAKHLFLNYFIWFCTYLISLEKIVRQSVIKMKYYYRTAIY